MQTRNNRREESFVRSMRGLRGKQAMWDRQPLTRYYSYELGYALLASENSVCPGSASMEMTVLPLIQEV